MAQESSRIERRTVVAVESAEGKFTGGTCDVRDGLGAISFGVRWYESRPVIGDVVLVEFPPPSGTRRVIAICREVKTGNGSGSTNRPATLSGNTATAGQLGDSDTEVGPVVYAADFGAIGDGTEDDTSPLQDAIDAVASNGGGTVICVSGGTHLTTGVLRINASAVTLDLNGATIRRVDTSDGTSDPVVQIMPDFGSSAVVQDAVVNGAIDGNGTAAQGILIQSASGPRLTSLQIFGATEWQLLTGSEEGVGDCDQLNVSGLTVVATGSAGGVKLDGDSDTTCTRGGHLSNLQITTVDGDGLYFGNTDTNNADLVRVAASGTGRGIVFAGSDVSADQVARYNHVYHAAVMGGVYSLNDDFPATGNKVDLNAGSAPPIVDDGSDITWISDHVGILGVDELPDLPDAAYPPGNSVVFLRVDDPPNEGGKLYRNVADVWTAAVPAADITDLDTSAIESDGVAPASSPTPTVEAGIGSLVARWTPVANNDLVFYEVHVSASSSFTPSGLTLYGETPGASMVIRKLPSGAAFAALTTYYVKLVAKDEDGSASAGSQGSAQVAQAGTDDIAANAITAAKVATDTLTANEIAASAITTSELASGSVTAAKIVAGTITSTEIASATIVAGNIASGTITTTQIASGTILAGNIASDTITAGEIAASAITTSELASNSVTAAKIVARTITADRLSVGSFDQLVANGGFETGATSDWTLPVGASISTTTPRSGTYELTMTATGTASSNRIYCATGDTIYAEAYVAKDAAGGTTTARINIAWYNSLGSVISRTNGTTTTVVMSGGGGVLYTQLTVGGTGANATAPAGTTWAQIELECVAFGGAGTTAVYFDDVYSRRTLTGSLIVDGAISASQIAANTITTAKLAITASVGYVDNSIGGTTTYGVTIDTSGITIKDPGGTSVLTGAGFGGNWLSFIQSNVYNAVFDSGPGNGNGTTLGTAVNPLTNVPNWTLVNVSGTHTPVTWRNDASVGRAGQIRFNLTATGAAGDQSYIYQNVPIPPSGSTAEGTHVVSINGSCTSISGSSLLFVKAQYLKADGATTTGTESTTEWTPLTGNLDTQLFYVTPNSGVQPTDAAYLRVKVGIRRGAAATTATMQIELYGVTVFYSPRYLFWGQGTHMGALTRGNDGWGGTVYLGSYDPSSGGFNFGMSISSSLFQFDTPVTMADNVSIVGVGTAFTVSNYGTTFRRDDGATVSTHRYFSGASTNGGIAAFTKSRGSTYSSALAAVAAGDILFALQFQGADAASGAYQTAAGVYGMADPSGTVSSGRVDGMLSFRTAVAGTLTEQMNINRNGGITIANGNGIGFGTTTGSIIATTAAQKIAFWGATPVAQATLAPTGVVAVPTAGATNTWFRNTTTAGGLGGNAYTVGDIVFALKTVGILP